MDGSLRHGRSFHPQLSSAVKQRRSGNELSDVETEWPESPSIGKDETKEGLLDEELKSIHKQSRNSSPGSFSKRKTERPEPRRDSMASPGVRRHSKSPHSLSNKGFKSDSDSHGNESSLSGGRKKHHKNLSPYKSGKESDQQGDDGFASSIRRQKFVNSDVSKGSDRSNSSRRSSSAPKPRFREKESFIKDGKKEPNFAERNGSAYASHIENGDSRKHTYLSGEINEMIANVKISTAPTAFAPNFGNSTDSIAPGDLFFSQDYATLAQRDNSLWKYGESGTKYSSQRPNITNRRNPDSHKENIINSSVKQDSQKICSPQMTTKYSTASTKRHIHVSDSSRKTAESNGKFITNRKKNQAETWFACIKKGSCGDTRKSPEKGRELYEAAIIEKTSVLENIERFWADKHQPASLSGFTTHKQQALLLKQLASIGIFPHILFKGPPGSGKKALTMALLREIFGPPVSNISHELRYFCVQETRPTEVAFPISSSPHHVELNVSSQFNAVYALMPLVKQISTAHSVTPEISTVNMKANYTVLVLYDVDKAEDRTQHFIKWIMDCYTDSCKLILCCEDDENILESVRSRCKVINVEAPTTDEITEVLRQIARKETFELPMSFAVEIANKSKRNMRKGIMALEACKEHNYPFAEDQPIPVGWEDILVELASEILADPSPNKLFLVRGQLRKLLASSVHPKLILLKLTQQFLKGVDAGAKRELFYWHAYYDKRLPSGTSALLKLEEFIAKFMSIQRKRHSHRQEP